MPLIASILLVALNLRPAITVLGPLSASVSTELNLSPAQFGLLTSIPLLMFALVSPAVAMLAKRYGPTSALLVALGALIGGTVLRSLPGSSAQLWVGTMIIGASIAVCNVLVPVFIKRDFPDHIPILTGAYTTVLSASAAVASGIAVPTASQWGWRTALTIWCAPAVLALLVWCFRGALGRPAQKVADPQEAHPSDSFPPRFSGWKSRSAWSVALFMGTQSLSFYLLVTWLPSIEAANGVTAVGAGFHLLVFQVASMATGIGSAAIIRRSSGITTIGVASSALMAVAMPALLLFPRLAPLWIGLAGVSAGAALAIALTLIGTRTATPTQTSELSGMAQGVGYLLAAIGLAGAGVVASLAGWPAVVCCVIAVALAQVCLAVRMSPEQRARP